MVRLECVFASLAVYFLSVLFFRFSFDVVVVGLARLTNEHKEQATYIQQLLAASTSTRNERTTAEWARTRTIFFRSALITPSSEMTG